MEGAIGGWRKGEAPQKQHLWLSSSTMKGSQKLRVPIQLSHDFKVGRYLPRAMGVPIFQSPMPSPSEAGVSSNKGHLDMPLGPVMGGTSTVATGMGLATCVTFWALDHVAAHGTSFPFIVTFISLVTCLVRAMTSQTK